MSIVEIRNAADYDRFLQNADRAIIFYGSKNCGHCQNAAREIANFAQQFPDVHFAHVEVTEVKVDNIGPVPVFVYYRRAVPVNSGISVKSAVPVNSVIGWNPSAINTMLASM